MQKRELAAIGSGHERDGERCRDGPPVLRLLGQGKVEEAAQLLPEDLVIDEPPELPFGGIFRSGMRFLLIHGGFHGAWCWERVIPELEAAGHDAVAIDLPGHGERVDDRTTVATVGEAILDALQDGDVVVGHSGGRYAMSLAAGLAPERFGHLL